MVKGERIRTVLVYENHIYLGMPLLATFTIQYMYIYIYIYIYIIHIGIDILYRYIQIWQHQDVKVILITLFGASFLDIEYGRGWN